MSQKTESPRPNPIPPNASRPSASELAEPSKRPWTKPAVVETSCGLEINCYAPAGI